MLLILLLVVEKQRLLAGSCKQNSSLDILIVTYNAKLRLETAERCIKHNIENCKIHTYHSLCNKYYTKSHDDSGIIKTCKYNIKPRISSKPDIIILDEQQDLNPDCFQLIIKYINDNCNNPKIIILGDENQSIYGFRKSDCRFLLEARNCFSRVSNHPWKILSINESFRVNTNVCSFVNKHIIKTNRLTSSKDGDKPYYIIGNMFDYHVVKNMLKNIFLMCKVKNIHNTEHDYELDDIFVLCNSIDNNKRICLIENTLVDLGYKCYKPPSDEHNLDINVMKGKIVFSTFHQAKGRERKIVFIVGFDDEHINRIRKLKTFDEKECVNSYYVGCTRALEKLFLLHHSGCKFFPTVESNELQQYCNFNFTIAENNDLEKLIADIDDTTRENKKPTSIGVTNIFKNISPSDADRLKKYFTINKTQLNKKINPDVISKMQDGTYEYVADLYGIAITLYNDTSTKTNNEIYKKSIEIIDQQQVSTDEEFLSKQTLIDIVNNNKYNKENIGQLLCLCNKYDSSKSGFKSRWAQIDSYEWANYDVVNDSNDIINDVIKTVESDNSSNIFDICKKRRREIYAKNNKININDLEDSNIKFYEYRISRVIDKINIVGDIDIMTPTTIYEIKCTSETTDGHILQLATYGCLDDIDQFNRLILINVKEGFMYEITNFNNKKEFMNDVVNIINRSNAKLTFNEFNSDVQGRIDYVLNSRAKSLLNLRSNIDLLKKLEKLNKK